LGLRMLRMAESPQLAAIEGLLRFVLTRTEDPEVQARQKLVAKVAFDLLTPEQQAELIAEVKAEKARLNDARSALRSVLAHRKLALGADDEARIDACTEPRDTQAMARSGPRRTERR